MSIEKKILNKKKFNFFKKDEKTDYDSNTLLSCHRVTKTFGALVAVNKLSFNVPKGIVFGIGGPNGAGKTTLFDVISGVQKIDNGDIRFNNQIITNKSPHSICNIGIARTFQLNAAFESMTVMENVIIGAHHGFSVSEIPKVYVSKSEITKAKDALAFVGLLDAADKVVSSLTHLELKLLMIASAIATKPKLLLLDEPVGGLIPNEIEKVEKIVGRLTKEQNVTIILIEHVMRFLVGLSDEVLIMNYGEKLYQGMPEKMAEDKKVVDVYLGEGTSAKFEKLTAKKKLKDIPLADVDIDKEINDPWSLEVEKASRNLIKQKKTGKIYPIDFMKLERLIEERKESSKTTKVSRAASGLISARKSNANLEQHFELLERMIEEVTNIRSKIPETKITKGLDKETKRSKRIENAALQVLSAEENNKLDKKDIDKLRAALMWEVATNSTTTKEQLKDDNRSA